MNLSAVFSLPSAEGKIELRKKLLRIILFFLLLIWCLGFSIKYLFPDSSISILLFPFLKKNYSNFCHQFEEKSFTGFLVCSRCSGIYIGALLSSLGLIFIKGLRKIHAKYLLLASLPMLIDIIFYSSGIYSYQRSIAFTTGLFFGSVVYICTLFLIEKNLLRLNAN